MTTSTITAPIATREEILASSEFSLVETSTGNIVGQLRFPPGLSRLAIRELVTDLKQTGEILYQRCIGNTEATISWSSLLFVASLATYHWLKAKCQASNLESLRNATDAKLASLEEQATLPESEVEAQAESSKLAKFIKITDESQTQIESEVEAQAESSKLAKSIKIADEAQTQIEAKVAAQTQIIRPKLASSEQLLELTLSKLKELAATHSIVGRSSMTKNLKTARQILVPQLVGVVTVIEL